MSNEIIPSNKEPEMNVLLSHRQALKLICGLGASLAGTVLLSGIRAEAQNADHSAHAARTPMAETTKYQELIDAALAGVNRGEVCINHCARQLGAGDTSLKDCMSSVAAMLLMCTAVARFVAFDASRLKEVTKLCVDICTDCEKECRKHEQHHVQCKNCADSCAAFIREGKTVIGA
jgi:Cys-rich four helix bundle protein (predicted Tat secretion target)